MLIIMLTINSINFARMIAGAVNIVTTMAIKGPKTIPMIVPINANSNEMIRLNIDGRFILMTLFLISSIN